MKFKPQATLVETYTNISLDAGSIPAASIFCDYLSEDNNSIMESKHATFLLLLSLSLLFFLLCFYPSVYAAEKVSVYLDGRYAGKIDIFISPEGKALLPVRDLFRLLGGSVGWIGSTKETYIQLAGKKVTIKIGSNQYSVDGETGKIEAPLSVINSRLIIPCDILKKVWGYDCSLQGKRLNIDTTLPVLENFYYKKDKDKIDFIFKFSKKPEIKVGKLINPPRIFVDLYNTSSRVAFGDIPINSEIVERVRSGRFTSSILRVVFDLRTDGYYTTSEAGKDFILSIYPSKTEVVQPTPLPGITSTPSVQWTPPKEHKKKIIILDPGHGGKDPGAIGRYGTREKNIVLSIALRLKSILEQNGFTVYMTRSSDTFIPLQKRPQIANRKNGDLFISIHVNSAPRNTKASGIETFYLSSRYSDPQAKEVAKRENTSSFTGKPLSEEELIRLILSDLLLTVNIEDSSKFAGIVEKQLTKYVRLPVRGVKTAPFIVLKGLKMPAVLVELGFISNPKEETLLKTKDFQTKLAKGIASAVKLFFRGRK